MLGGRDPEALLDTLDVDQVDLVVTTTAPSPRAIPAEELARLIDARGVEVSAIDDVAVAIGSAMTIANPDDAIIVTGSMYVAGAARTYFELGD
jgi:folylpolyglutamate synthase/dihydropteroate synthase